MKKILALVLSLCMVLSMGTIALAADASDPAVQEAYVDYIYEWLLAEDAVNDNMDINIIETEFMPLVKAGDFVSFPADMLFNGMLNNGCPMTIEEFAAQYVPAEGGSGEASAEAKSAEEAYIEYLHEFLLAELEVNTGGMTLEIIENEFMPQIKAGQFEEPPAALLFNGLLDSGVAMTFEEFEAQYVPAGEALSVEDAFVDYIYNWLLEEQKVNTGGMTIEIIETEFMPLIEAGDYVSFPAEMLWSGMLDSGCPMTFEEFAAQYVPAAPAAAEPAADPQAAYADYIYEWLLAEDAVNDNMDINIIETEFMPLVEAGDFVSFPADMLFNGMLNNGCPMTFEEWSAQQ